MSPEDPKKSKNNSAIKQSYDSPNYALRILHIYLDEINNKSQAELLDFAKHPENTITNFKDLNKHPQFKSEFDKFYARVRAHIFEQGEDGATWIKKRFSQMEEQVEAKNLDENDPKRLKALNEEMAKIDILLDEWNKMSQSKQYGDNAQQLTDSIDEITKFKKQHNESNEVYTQGQFLDQIINNKSESGLKLFIKDVAFKIENLKSDPSRIETQKKYAKLYSRANNALADLHAQNK